ncbi:MAG TPA: helix-turn-helix domain-containing protein [Candidatus Desulfovibrio intestinipullorum]|uniref:Helix-turn-helix domain-containing protein n=1 Tax=Candidatus Desulfovibrio intestinipullorum TaxID=2838536 RepID=A0A9D1PYG4_9BACT|nr:helix-turn-helix domain-containing protein [Candidatus Desulfovibrio intestinipullorum]
MSNILVIRSIRKLGRDIKSARLRRRLPMFLVAERAGISTRTLSSLEKGEPGVSIGNVAAVIVALGMGTPFSTILDQKNDTFGLLLDEGRLPKRARLPRQETFHE